MGVFLKIAKYIQKVKVKVLVKANKRGQKPSFKDTLAKVRGETVSQERSTNSRLLLSAEKAKLFLLALGSFVYDFLKWFVLLLLSSLAGFLVFLVLIIAAISVIIYGVLHIDFGDAESSLYSPESEKVVKQNVSIDWLFDHNFPVSLAGNIPNTFLANEYRECYVISNLMAGTYGDGYTNVQGAVERDLENKKNLLYVRIGMPFIESPTALGEWTKGNILTDEFSDDWAKSFYGMIPSQAGNPLKFGVGDYCGNVYMSPNTLSSFTSEFVHPRLTNRTVETYMPHLFAHVVHFSASKARTAEKDVDAAVEEYSNLFGFSSSKEEFRQVARAVGMYDDWLSHGVSAHSGVPDRTMLDDSILLLAAMWYLSSEEDATRSMDSWSLGFPAGDFPVCANIWNFKHAVNKENGSGGTFLLEGEDVCSSSCLLEYVSQAVGATNSAAGDYLSKCLLPYVSPPKSDQYIKTVYAAPYSYMVGKEVVRAFAAYLGSSDSKSLGNGLYGVNTVENLVNWALTGWGHCIYVSGGGYSSSEDHGVDQAKYWEAIRQYAINPATVASGGYVNKPSLKITPEMRQIAEFQNVFGGAKSLTRTDKGADCAGYFTWLWRNTLSQGPPYSGGSWYLDCSSFEQWVGTSSKENTDRGGSWSKYFANPMKVKLYDTSTTGACGDAFGRPTGSDGSHRHVGLVLGKTSDGGYVLLHCTSYSPPVSSSDESLGGVILSGTTTESAKLAYAYSKKYFPDRYSSDWRANMFPTEKGSVLYNHNSNPYLLCYLKQGVLDDPAGLRSMSAEEVLEYFLGPL